MRKKSPLADEAYEYILDKILKCEILPGEAISDYTLTQELNMSRVPIREAILRLESDGLIERGKVGVICARISPKDIREICRLRLSLELLALDIIFENGGLSNQQANELLLVYDAFSQETQKPQQENYIKNYYWDDKFHSTIINFTDNSRLIQFWDQLQLQMSRARWLNVLHPRHYNAYKEHEAIFNALIKKDKENSILATTKHLEGTRENFDKIFETPQYRIMQAGIK